MSIKTQAQLHSAQLRAKTELERQTTLSQAQMESEINNVEANKIMATAEGRIAKWVKKRNEFSLSLQKIKNFEALTDNQRAIISHSSSSDENVMSVAESILDGRNDMKPKLSSEAEDNLTPIALVSPAKEGKGVKGSMKK